MHRLHSTAVKLLNSLDEGAETSEIYGWVLVGVGDVAAQFGEARRGEHRSQTRFPCHLLYGLPEVMQRDISDEARSQIVFDVQHLVSGHRIFDRRRRD